MSESKKKKLGLPAILLIVEVVLIAAMALLVILVGKVGSLSSFEVIGHTLNYYLYALTFGLAGSVDAHGTLAMVVGAFSWVSIILVIFSFVASLKGNKKSLLATLAFALGSGLVSLALCFCFNFLLSKTSFSSKANLLLGVGLVIVAVVYLLSVITVVVDMIANLISSMEKQVNEAKDEAKAASSKAEQAEKAAQEQAASPAAQTEEDEDEESDLLTVGEMRDIIREEIAAAFVLKDAEQEARRKEEARAEAARKAEEEKAAQEKAAEEAAAQEAQVEEQPTEEVTEEQPVEEAAEEQPAEETAEEQPAESENTEESTTVVAAEVTAEAAADAEDEEGDENAVAESSKGLIIKRNYVNKLKFINDKCKDIYGILHNELDSYGCNARMSKKAETFKKHGMVCRLVVKGKGLKVFFDLDPNNTEKYPESRYHQKDYSSKKVYADTPFGMDCRSDRACARAIELITAIMEERGVKKSKKFEPKDFKEELLPDGAAILEVTGNGHMLKTDGPVTLEEASKLPDSMLEYVPTIDLPKTEDEEVSSVILGTAVGYTTDIKHDTLKNTQSWYSSIHDMIKVRANKEDPLDMVVRVEAEEIDNDTAKMILMRGGKVVKINRV